MICNGCNNDATHLVEGQPHCKKHMLEALCGVYVKVLDLDCLSPAQRKEVVKSGQAPIAKTA